jgi:hypothetical protein
MKLLFFSLEYLDLRVILQRTNDQNFGKASGSSDPSDPWHGQGDFASEVHVDRGIGARATTPKFSRRPFLFPEGVPTEGIYYFQSFHSPSDPSNLARSLEALAKRVQVDTSPLREWISRYRGAFFQATA